MEQEIFTGFTHPTPRPLSPWAFVGRRGRQLFDLAFSQKYSSRSQLMQGVVQHYSQSKEVAFYQAYSQFGLHQNEERILQTFFKRRQTVAANALVVGCGGGRECFHLAESSNIQSIVGIDSSDTMIRAARSASRFSNIQLTCAKVTDLHQTFDLIWVTAILESHIQGRQHRIDFFKELKKHLAANGSVILTPQIRKLHWRSSQFWASLALRLRLPVWEPGDSLVGHMGLHNINRHLVYSHFYKSVNDLVNELQAAGFTSFLRDEEGSWLIQ